MSKLKQKNPGVPTLIPEKADIKKQNTIRNKEIYFIDSEMCMHPIIMHGAKTGKSEG